MSTAPRPPGSRPSAHRSPSRRLAGLGLLALVTALSACNPAGSPAQDVPGPAEVDFAAEPTGELVVSGYNPSDEVAQARSDHATGRLPGVGVTLDSASFDTQRFAAQTAAGDVPDLVRAGRNQIATLADQGLVQSLDRCFEAGQVVAREYFYPAVVDDVAYQDELYGVPEFFQPSALLLNTRLLDEAGIAVEDVDTSDPQAVVALADELARSEGGVPTRLGFDADLPGSAATWMLAQGGQIFDADGRPSLDTAENVAALEWMAELMAAQGGYPSVASFKDSLDVFGEQNPYVTDEVAVQAWGQWYVNVVADSADQVELAAVPIRDLDGDPVAVAGGGSAFAVPSGAANPAAACAWALEVTSVEAWLAGGEARAATVEAEDGVDTGLFTGSPVADQAVRETYVDRSGDPALDQVIDVYYDILANPVTQGASAVGEPTGQALQNAVVVSLSGEAGPAEALAEAQATALRAWDQSRAGR